MAETFGEALRRWRTDRGLTLRQLAGKAHVDPGHLSRLERGERPPTDHLVKALDIALDAGGQLSSLVVASIDDVPYDPMRRRNLLQFSLAAATVAGLASAAVDGF